MKFRTLIVSMVASVICMLMIPALRADVVTAYGWITPEEIASNTYGETYLVESLFSTYCAGSSLDPTNGHCAPSNANVIFTTGTTSLNFDNTYALDGTIGAWLGSSKFPIDILRDNAPNAQMDSTIWEFVGNLNVTGTDANPQMFTIDHDDGVTLLINGQFVINSPGPSFGPPNPFFFSSGLYTGGAGVVPFELVYAECCGFPARLKTDLPEPSAVLLLGTVLLGLGFKFKRKISPRSHCSTEVSEAQR